MTLTKSVLEIISKDKTGLLAKHPSWERVPLREIADVLNGFPFQSAYFNVTSGMPLVRIRDVLTGTTNTLYSGSFDEDYLVNRGELLVGMDGDFNLARWQSGPALLNQRVCKITANEAYYSQRFLGYIVPSYLAAINAETSSITVKHLSSRTVEEISLPLPPREEQERIVGKLEELFSDLEAGMTELKAAQKKLEKYRQSLLKAAVDGTLTASWREAQRQAGDGSRETGAQLLERILAERRAQWETKEMAKFREQGKVPPKGWQERYPKPVAPHVAELPILPEGWVWSSLDELIEIGPQNGLYLPASYYGRGHSILRIDDFQNDWTRAREHLNQVEADGNTRMTYALQLGDLVVNRVNSVTHLGKSLIVNKDLAGALFESNMMRIGLTKAVCAKFIGFYLGAGVGRDRLISNAKWAVNQASINQQDVKKTPVPLPSATEQAEIVEKLCTAGNGIAVQASTIKTGLQKCAAQRQNILRAAFSGRLVPQDPNDEPAAILLERIRAQRAARTATTVPRQRRAKSTA